MLTLIVLASMLQSVSPADANPASKPAPKICRRYPVIGNRAKFEKVCRTAAEWRELNDMEKRRGAEVINRVQSRGLDVH